MATEKSTFLYMTAGSSDKAYNVHLVALGDDTFNVVAENGRRGSTLKQGVKNKAPLDRAQAEALFDKTVGEKTRKGYTEDISGAAFAGTCEAGRVTGFEPMLLNAIETSDLPAVFSKGIRYAAQIKYDGERRGMIFDEATITAANRRGLEVPVGEKVTQAVAYLRKHGVTSAVLDGEMMGEELVVFDILSVNGLDLRDAPFSERRVHLDVLDGLVRFEDLGISVAATWDVSNADEARRVVEMSRERGEEGVVFRDLAAPYSVGRPSSGGPALKLKNWANATVRVCEGRGDKRSVGIEMQDGIEGPWRPVGNVTIPERTPMPDAGTLLEVRYLYAYEGGSLFQPTLIGVRTDVTEEACQLCTLVYKRTEVA